MIGKTISPKTMFILGVISIILMILAYLALSHHQHVIQPEDTTIPNLSQLKQGIINLIEASPKGERWIVVDSKATYVRLFLGMLVGVISAFILGVLMGCFPIMEAFLLPPLSLLAKIAPTAAISVFFVFCGIGWKLYIAMIAFGIIPSLAQSVYLGIRDVPGEMLDKARTLGASKGELVWNIVIKYIMPRFIDAVRLQIGPAVVYLIAAEMLLSHEGFGYRIRLEFKKLNMNVVYPYLIILASTTFCFDYSLRVFQRIFFKWYSGERR